MSLVMSNSSPPLTAKVRLRPFNCPVAQSLDAFDDSSSHVYTKFAAKQGW
jgi:hypothetical protein